MVIDAARSDCSGKAPDYLHWLRIISSLRNKFALATLVIFALALFPSACGSKPDQEVDAEANALMVRVVASDVGLGTARIALSIQKIDGSSFDDFADQLEVTYAATESDQIFLVNDLKWRAWPIRSGVYTATMTFDQVGFWSIEVRSKNGDLLPATSGLLVKSSAETPDIGDPAPLSKTKTNPPGGDLRKITSAPTPDPDLYAISFDDAVATGRPTVITFSTPAYCESGLCGPQTEVLSELDDKYTGRVNFIHVEIFDNPEEMLAAGDPSLGVESAVIHEWEFITEPWTFVVDGSGIVTARFEAFVTLDEIEENLAKVLDGA
jgi:hypothetical protein